MKTKLLLLLALFTRAAAQQPVSEVSISATVLSVDPASGELLLLERESGKFFARDFTRWREVPARPPLFKTSRNIIATPITNYGVVLFAQEDGPVLIYKHHADRAPLKP